MDGSVRNANIDASSSALINHLTLVGKRHCNVTTHQLCVRTVLAPSDFNIKEGGIVLLRCYSSDVQSGSRNHAIRVNFHSFAIHFHPLHNWDHTPMRNGRRE